MTKKELFEALKNVDDNAQILFGKNDYSDYFASEIYIKTDHEDTVAEVLITNEFIPHGVSWSSFDKIF